MNESVIDIPFRPLVPHELLGANAFYSMGYGQIIFYYAPWQQFVITDISPEKNYSILAYESLPENALFQLIHGKLLYMAAPKPIHQRISQRINRELDSFVFSNKLGEVFYAPVDVQLGENSVVQPDLLFISISRAAILPENASRIVGAPDFIVEILSSNEYDDRVRKMELYAAHNVLEYWIIDITAEVLEQYTKQETGLELVTKAQKTETVRAQAIAGFELDLSKIFV